MAITSAIITGVAPTTLYTSSGNNAVTCLWICNTATFIPATPTLDQVTIDVHFCKNGAGVTTTNKVVSGLTVPAGESVTFDTEKMILDNGDYVALYVTPTSAVNLSATISTIPV